MEFLKSLHAKGWHVAAAAVGIVAFAALAALADPQPLDAQLTSAMNRSGDTLNQWHAQFSHGLKVSLRAVADGDDRPAIVAKAR